MSQATNPTDSPTPPPGLFITFEGLDGSGKTTQLKQLAAALESDGHRVVTLRQPGGTPLGDRIRSILLDSRSESDLGAIAPEAEMALMFADRAQSLRQVILPALATVPSSSATATPTAPRPTRGPAEASAPTASSPCTAPSATTSSPT